MKISNIKKISGRMLSYIVSRESIITFITCVAVSIIIGACMVYSRKDEDKSIKVGIIYVGDASTAYTDNFIEALADIKEEYGDKVEVMHMYNVAEGTEREYLERLINAGCNLIFSTSYNYGETTKELAGRYPDVQFCMATCSNANEEPYYANYHTFMGAIYEGSLISPDIICRSCSSCIARRKANVYIPVILRLLKSDLFNCSRFYRIL